jgi:hypothetical protein
VYAQGCRQGRFNTVAESSNSIFAASQNETTSDLSPQIWAVGSLRILECRMLGKDRPSNGSDGLLPDHGLAIGGW